MELKKLYIENFRNYESVELDLSNQNVVFGMNDVGKTNLMQSIRFLLDRDIRKNGFKETDYFQNDISRDIKITLKVSLNDYEASDDTKNVVSKVRGARTQDELNDFYFQVEGIYDQTEYFGNPKLYWGNKFDELEEVSQSGSFTVLDKLFKIVYIDPTIDLDLVFSKNRRKLFDQSKLNEEDVQTSNDIKSLGRKMNKKIGSMNVIKDFQTIITNEYKMLKKEEIEIEMKSELTINGYFENLIPYIKRNDDENHYPTSGDGRKKILAYSLLNHLTKEHESNKIIIYLIEEPENSLHRSMQIALSKQLFETDVYKYFFLSTHSSELLYEMDHASLIRIYSENKTNCASYIYHVDKTYKSVKKELNRSLSTALFADKVLLIEGPSEKVLFEKILEKTHPTYELEGGYLLDVGGIKFKPYVEVLRALHILPIVKTDNDLKAKRGNDTTFDLIGINRCLELIQVPKKKAVKIDYFFMNGKGERVSTQKSKEEAILKKKKDLFKRNKKSIDELKKNKIFLSKVDLEHDLFEALGIRMEKILGKNPIKYLQSHKLINMIELTNKLTIADCKTILAHKHFLALKELVEDAN